MEYSEKVREEVEHPQNRGKLEDADAVGQIGSPVCGDTIEMYIKVKGGRIFDIGWETMGCAASIATASVLSGLVKGKTLKDALKIKKEEVLTALDNLPAVKTHCSNLALGGLHDAIRKYKIATGEITAEDMSERISLIKPCTKNPNKVLGETNLSDDPTLKKEYFDIEKITKTLEEASEFAQDVKKSDKLGLVKFKVGEKEIMLFRNGRIVINTAADKEDLVNTLKEIVRILGLE